ncbi:MAG: sugar transferase [Actinobacteria bacterium]|nr:sugar transferase [Actinomycetota bacterium]
MILKRAVDLVVGTALAVLAFPFIAVGAIGSALSLRAWPFFVQHRVGKEGKPFPLPKLRTLPPTVPSAVDKYALDAVRIPRFCRLLRRTHLDELPQLLVVPLGWMSLVGPRPEMPSLLARYPTKFALARSAVRPGCTGLWQISVASRMLIYEAPQYDLVYAEYRSAVLDAWILCHTVRMLLIGRAAVDIEGVPSWVLRPARKRSRRRVIDLRTDPSGIVVDIRNHERAKVVDLYDYETDSRLAVDEIPERGMDARVLSLMDEVEVPAQERPASIHRHLR